MILKSLFKKFGYENFILVEDGEAALYKLKKSDLIL
jgi:hypothetical protein